ncbi:MAG: hypothetical protein ABI411_10835 [Tahibacter sp.]
MNTILKRNNSARRKPQPAISAPLPVIDIGNNLITCCTYLSAVESATLPSVVTDDPQYAALATAYADWQATVWEQFYLSLLNAGVLAQAEVMNNLVSDGINQQLVYADVINPSGGPTPTVIALCDDMGNQVMAGEVYVSQLSTIVQGIQGADEAKLTALNQLVNTLNSQFNALENQLTEKALDNSKQAFVTVIKVVVETVTEEDPIEPLLEGIAQVGTDIIEELVLTQEIQQTLLQLESAWAELDEVTLQVAQLNLVLNRLNAVVSDSSATMAALGALVDDWQTISDVITGSAASWQSGGYEQVAEWASRMVRISFPTPVTQTVPAS